MLDKVEKYSDTIAEMAIEYAPRLALAIVTLVVGLVVIGFVLRFLVRQLNNSGADPSLTPFVRGILSVILKIVLLVAVAGMVGIKTTSFVAVIGAAGLAVGLALQGSLSNFAGSILILFFKPYKVGDVVEIQGETGTIEEIQIFNTKMTTFDNKVIFIPNGKVANNNIKNISYNPTRRLDFTFGIGYSDDIDLAKDTIREVISKHSDKLVKDKDVFVKVTKLNDSSVDFAVKIWVAQEDFWDLNHAIIEEVKKAFDAKDISIPFPQRDVHIFQENK